MLLLSLLLGAFSKVAYSQKYNLQYIIVVGNNQVEQEAVQFLQSKNMGISHFIQLDPTTKDLKHVKWDASTEIFVGNESNDLPDDLPVEQEGWSRTRIQVVGHGDENSEIYLLM